jgi:hypothetical protein
MSILYLIGIFITRRHEQFISDHHHHYHHGHTSGHGNSHGNYEHQITVHQGYGGAGSSFAQTSSHNGGFGQLLTQNRGDKVPERRVTVDLTMEMHDEFIT